MHVTLIQKSMKKRDFVERLFSLSLQRMQLPEQLFSRYVCTHIKNNEYNEKYESLFIKEASCLNKTHIVF